MERNKWSKEETILAFDLYCRTPFGKIHASNKDVIELSTLLRRTPASVSMKMCNLASLDPELQKRGKKGLSHRCKLEEVVWKDFQYDWESLALDSKRILAEYKKVEIDKTIEFDIDSIPLGQDKERFVKQRVGQYFFRMAVLSSYENKCCITGITLNTLLVASHIKPWKDCDVRKERTNPSNGLCLNPLHDKAFDQGLITIDKNYKIIVSEKLKNRKVDNITKAWIIGYGGEKIILPHRFLPEKQFIEYHNDLIFQH